MKIRIAHLVMAALLATSAIGARADTLTESSSFNFSNVNPSLFNNYFVPGFLQAFNTNLGSLSSVNFSLFGTSTVQTVVNGNGAAVYPISFTSVPTSAQLSIYDVGGSTFVQTETDSAAGTITAQQPLFTSTGTTYAVTTSQSYTSGLSAFESVPNGLIAFAPFTIQYNSPTFSSGGGLISIGGGLSIPAFTASPIAIFQGTASVTYTYVPVPAVPEPGEWLLMMFGLGFINFVTRRRKSCTSDLPG